MTEDMVTGNQMEGLVKGWSQDPPGISGGGCCLSPATHLWDLASSLISALTLTPPCKLCPSWMLILSPGALSDPEELKESAPGSGQDCDR